MLKISGMILILLSCSAAGVGYSLQIQKRLRQLREQQKMITMLEREISYGIATLPEALQRISERIEEPFGKFLWEVSIRLRQNSDNTLTDIWRQGVQEFLETSFLSARDKEELMDLGKYLGYLDITTQKHMMDLHKQELEFRIQQVENTLDEKKKLYRSLGVLSGLFLAVTLW